MADGNSEPTKSLWYAVLDLSVKAISALGVISLGYVGWQLQSAAQRREALDTSLERSGNLLLPAIQVFAQLQVAFSSVASHVDLGRFEPPNGSRSMAPWKLQYIVASLHLPIGYRDTIKLVPLAKYESGRLLQPDVEVSYRAAAAMVAEVWQNIPYLRAVCDRVSSRNQPGDVQLFANAPTLYFAQERGKGQPGDEMMFLGPDSFPAWKAWFPKEGMTAIQMCNTNFRQLFHDVAVGGGVLSGQIMLTYPMLAERAVALRTQALEKVHASLGE